MYQKSSQDIAIDLWPMFKYKMSLVKGVVTSFQCKKQNECQFYLVSNSHFSQKLGHHSFSSLIREKNPIYNLKLPLNCANQGLFNAGLQIKFHHCIPEKFKDKQGIS